MRYPVKVRPLPWWGGKAGYGKSDWICSLLPWKYESVYVEPFGGMAGVLVKRDRVDCEIYNDLDSLAVNWWRMIREREKELERLVSLTPHSREEFQRALSMLDHPCELERAWAFHVVLSQGMHGSTSASKSDWTILKTTRKGGRSLYPGRWLPERMKRLAGRFWRVQIENKPAIVLLDWIADNKDCVVYCDPPYRTATTSKYKHSDVDVNRLTAALVSQKGQVAISGYGDEWEHLSWQRHSMQSWIVSNGANKISEPRTEVLWTNYDAHSEQAIGGLFA